MTKIKAKSKPDCDIGTACGYACISSELSCQDIVQADVASGLLKSVRANVTKVASADMLVNTGGLLASMAGKAVGGDAGQLAGDLLGALAVRAVVKVQEATVAGVAKAKRDEAFESATKLEQLRKVAGATLSEMRSPEFLSKLADDLTGDVSGWAVGNASANALGQVGLLARVPFKGAAVASVAVPQIVEARRQLSAWLRARNSNETEFSEATTMTKTRAEVEQLLKQTADSLLSSLQESILENEAKPSKLIDFTLDGNDFVGIFATSNGDQYSFRLTEDRLLYASSEEQLETQPVAEGQ